MQGEKDRERVIDRVREREREKEMSILIQPLSDTKVPQMTLCAYSNSNSGQHRITYINS